MALFPKNNVSMNYQKSATKLTAPNFISISFSNNIRNTMSLAGLGK